MFLAFSCQKGLIQGSRSDRGDASTFPRIPLLGWTLGKGQPHPGPRLKTQTPTERVVRIPFDLLSSFVREKTRNTTDQIDQFCINICHSVCCYISCKTLSHSPTYK